MFSYKLDNLTDFQMEKLTDLKLDVIRSNQIYPKNHPEINFTFYFLL